MPRYPLAIALLAGMLCGAAGAENRYIDDSLMVPLRGTFSTDGTMVHQGLPRGTAVTLMDEKPDLGWSQVRTLEGLEGWMPSRYLKREPGARYQVLSALRLLGQPEDGSVSLEDAVKQGQTSFETLRAERDALTQQLAELRRISENATVLDRNNRQLGEELQMLKNELSVAQADNQRLRDSAWQKWAIVGCWATGIGGALTLFAYRLAAGRRRRSEWI